VEQWKEERGGGKSFKRKKGGNRGIKKAPLYRLFLPPPPGFEEGKRKGGSRREKEKKRGRRQSSRGPEICAISTFWARMRKEGRKETQRKGDVSY